MTSKGMYVCTYACVHVSGCSKHPRPLHESLHHPLPPTGGEGGGGPPRITLGEEGVMAPTPPPRSQRSGSRASMGTDSSLLGMPSCVSLHHRILHCCIVIFYFCLHLWFPFS